MADNSAQDKNLPATERRLAKAREDGEVVRSRDLGHLVAVGGGGALVVAFAPDATRRLADALGASLRFDRSAIASTGSMADAMATGAGSFLSWVLPLGALAIVLAALAQLLVGGPAWTAKALQFRLGAINPLAGLARLVARKQLVDTLKACTLALVLGALGYLWLRSHIGAWAEILTLPLPAALEAVAAALVGGGALLVGALAVFAVVDVPIQKRLHAHKLRMSHQEVKQEVKELEGNAEVKSKVRARMREMTRRRMMSAVPKADLVVMNPTHYAVALAYDEKTMAAPRVVAKGADLLALRIRDLARSSSVPVLDSPRLARALWAHAELDGEVPAALFAAVAQVLAYVYQLRAALAGRVPMPATLAPVDVPAGLDPHERAGA
jgi:flagellar biosynthetic protein FlhB